MEVTDEIVEKIQQANENEALRLNEKLILWKEGSKYDLDVTNRQFDDLEKILKENKDQQFYLIDLSLAKRPSPEVVQLIEKRTKKVNKRFNHVAVYTGGNHIMYIGIKFYFIRFDFPSYSAHRKLSSALNSFSRWKPTK